MKTILKCIKKNKNGGNRELFKALGKYVDINKARDYVKKYPDPLKMFGLMNKINFIIIIKQI